MAAGWGGGPPPPTGPALGRSNPSVGDVIETMFTVYRDTFVTTAAVLAVLVLPGLVLLGIAFLQVGDLWRLLLGDPQVATQVTEAQVVDTFSQPLLWVTGATGAVVLLLGQLAVIPALLRVGTDHLDGREPELGRSLRVAGRRMWGIAGIWILLFLLVAVVVLLPLPLLLVDTTFALLFIVTVPLGFAGYLVMTMVGYLVSATVVVEDRGAWESLGRVRSLLSGTFWPTFGRGLLIGLLVGLIGQVLGFASQFTVFAGPEVAIVSLVVVAILGYLVSTPLGIYGGLALYGDLCIRAEGTDVLGAAGRLPG